MLRKKDIFIIVNIFLIILSFFLGFIINENSAGAGGYFGDLKYIWRNQIIFLKNSLGDAIAHKDYFDSRSPIAYILHKYLNPFTGNIEDYRKSILAISCIFPILFYFYLKKKFNSNKILLVLLSCLILLSPYFRTSGYWALEENYGLIFLLLTGYMILKYQKNSYIFLKLNNNYFYIILVCFFSSATFYFDQKLIIIPLLSLIFILKKFSYREKIFAITVFFIFSIPYIYFMNIWGSIVPPVATKRAFVFDWENIGYFISIIGFYIFPFIFFKENLVENIKKFIGNKINIFLLIVTIFYLIYFFITFDDFYDKWPSGNGVVHKIAKILFEGSIVEKFSTVFLIFFFTVVILFFFSTRHDRFIILYFLLLSLMLAPIYQEYLDPLIFVMLFTFFKEKININHNLLVALFLYFSFFLICSNIYYKSSVYYYFIDF